MKLILSILLPFLFLNSFGQIVVRASPRKDSTANSATKYINFFSTPNTVTGVSLVVVKASGFTKGTAVLQRRIDTLPASVNTWQTTGSTFTFTNQTDGDAFIWPISVHDGNGYRIKVVTVDSTQKLYLYGSYLKN